MRGILAALTLMGVALAGADEVQTFSGCSLVVTEWADGDSFLVKFPDGNEHTVRLYGVDCIEWHVTDTTDARRLRAQRRYFGLSSFGGDSRTSITKAKQLGESAGLAVRKRLSTKFDVTTAFADARGDGRYRRVYGFVRMADGRDLGEVLVESGLARAFGVYRGRPGGQSGDDYRERLKDLELKAAKLGSGAWKFTDWEALPDERKEERDEAADLAVATGGGTNLPQQSIDPNSAARDQLMQLPGVGEVLANRIIETRADGPYQSAEDLARVPGIGFRTIEEMRQYLSFTERK